MNRNYSTVGFSVCQITAGARTGDKTEFCEFASVWRHKSEKCSYVIIEFFVSSHRRSLVEIPFLTIRIALLNGTIPKRTKRLRRNINGRHVNDAPTECVRAAAGNRGTSLFLCRARKDLKKIINRYYSSLSWLRTSAATINNSPGFQTRSN